MDAAPEILVVDDGELDRIPALLERLGLAWSRCLDADHGPAPPRPRDLLITSGPRAMRMPELPGEDTPVWLCIYDQDFLPLRDRLRDLGVHYLVSGDLEPRAFELFLHQLVHRGPERRAVRRIPLRTEIEVEVGFERRKALLVELSEEGCVFLTESPVPAERRVVVWLPTPLTGRAPVGLEGRVARASGRPGLAGVSTALRFAPLEGEAWDCLHQVLSGWAPGTQVTPLTPEPGVLEDPGFAQGLLVHGSGLEAAPASDRTPDAERRGSPRRPLSARVDAIGGTGAAPRTALGRDLSSGGMRIAVSPLPEVGSRLGLALYTGAPREEPLLVEAMVVRAESGEAALSFGALSPEQRHGLERLCGARAGVERLEPPATRLHVAEVVRG